MITSSLTGEMMGARSKTQSFIINGREPMYPNLESSITDARNLMKSQLGGVIFGCNNSTIKECLFKQLFGLPAQHFPYVKNIDPGLPLFLFNYSDRKFHGIFEAASSGQLNINPYGWTTDGSDRTQYPAQVQIRVRLQCQPLLEEQFKPIIFDNYYHGNHFWFELDHAQTNKLISLLASLAVVPSSPVRQNAVNWRTMFEALPSPKIGYGFKPLASEVEQCNQLTGKLDSIEVDSYLYGDRQRMEDQLDERVVEQEEKDLIFKKLQELALTHGPQDMNKSAGINEEQPEEKGFVLEQMCSVEKNEESRCTSSYCQSIVSQLVQEMEELKAFKTEQTLKMGHLEQKLVEAEEQIQQLKDRCMMLESTSNPSTANIEEAIIESLDELHLDPSESIYLVGGYDGESWLSSLDSYFPSPDVIKSLRPMSSIRSYASAVQLYDELYVFGGGNGYLWYDTVESYNPATDQWTPRPSLTVEKGSLAGATLNEKIFAVGGGNGVQCFSDVEMLDLDVGQWIRTRSMLEKRFALAAAELNGVLYATGGFDGNDYLKSAERFDPREHAWTKIASMNTRRGCHSLVVLNDKLYALGGFDGSTMVKSTEVFDPRLSAWMTADPMNQCRGYSAAAVLKEAIYIVGGVKSGEIIVDTVEHFKEGQGWQETKTKSIKKICFLSAVVL